MFIETHLATVELVDTPTPRVRFEQTYTDPHNGSVQALKARVSALRNRAVRDVPAGGLTRDDCDERHWTITYKLPALVLTYALPELCTARGKLPHLSLFASVYQKPQPNSPLSDHYPSPLPKIYQMLLAEHDDDAATLQKALPGLVERIARFVETGAEGAQTFDKALTQAVLQAGHQVQGDVLSQILGTAWQELGLR